MLYQCYAVTSAGLLFFDINSHSFTDTFKDFAHLVRRKLEIFIFLMILTTTLAVLQAASRGPWL